MAIQKLHAHPEIILRTDRLLCSINDRLGGGSGEDFEPLTLDFILDAVDLHLQEAQLLDNKKDEPENVEVTRAESYWQEFKL